MLPTLRILVLNQLLEYPGRDIFAAIVCGFGFDRALQRANVKGQKHDE